MLGGDLWFLEFLLQRFNSVPLQGYMSAVVCISLIKSSSNCSKFYRQLSLTDVEWTLCWRLSCTVLDTAPGFAYIYKSCYSHHQSKRSANPRSGLFLSCPLLCDNSWWCHIFRSAVGVEHVNSVWSFQLLQIISIAKCVVVQCHWLILMVFFAYLKPFQYH